MWRDMEEIETASLRVGVACRSQASDSTMVTARLTNFMFLCRAPVARVNARRRQILSEFSSGSWGVRNESFAKPPSVHGHELVIGTMRWERL